MQPSPFVHPLSTGPSDQMVSFNGRFMPLALLPVSPLNRAFQYGDSLFETIAIRNGKPQRLVLHIKRIKKGSKVLRLNWSERITEETLAPVLLELAAMNRIEGDVRFRWQIWRGDGGKFIPDSTDANQLITAEPLAPFEVKLKTAVVSEGVKVSVSSFSAFKTGNCLPYILAGLEAKEKKVDDVILLGGRFEIAESISSNIFWIKQNRLYTPSLHSGCVDGIMRRCIIDWCRKNQIEVVRVRSSVRHLLQADAAFTSNVTGIHYLALVNGQKLPTPYPLVEEMIKDLV